RSSGTSARPARSRATPGPRTSSREIGRRTARRHSRATNTMPRTGRQGFASPPSTTKESLRSIRSSFRGRTTERGYVLISAIVLAILYFALMELMLIDSSRAVREAQRFRARIVATTLAESAAELAALQLVTASGGP